MSYSQMFVDGRTQYEVGMSEISLLSMRAFGSSMGKVSPEQRRNDLETLVNKINEIVKKVNEQGETNLKMTDETQTDDPES